MNHMTRKNLKHASASVVGLKMSVASVLPLPEPTQTDASFPSHLQYVGISRSDYNHNNVSAPTQEQGVVIQCGGLAAMTVDEDVFVGDVVCARLPSGPGKRKARIMANDIFINLSFYIILNYFIALVIAPIAASCRAAIWTRSRGPPFSSFN